MSKFLLISFTIHNSHVHNPNLKRTNKFNTKYFPVTLQLTKNAQNQLVRWYWQQQNKMQHVNHFKKERIRVCIKTKLKRTYTSTITYSVLFITYTYLVLFKSRHWNLTLRINEWLHGISDPEVDNKDFTNWKNITCGKGPSEISTHTKKIKKERERDTNFSPPTTTSLYSVIFINDKTKATAQNYEQLMHCRLSSRELDLLY